MRYRNSDQRSWWESRELAGKRDLIVVGSGITGLSTALFFKRNHPQASVMVLDRGFWPHGATGRNAGFACFGAAGELTDDLKNESRDEVKQRLEARFRGLQLLRSELGEDSLDYRQCGGYEIFDDPEHYAESLANMGLLNEWIASFSGMKDSFSPQKYNGFDAVFNPLEGYLNSGKLIRRLWEKAAAAGVEVRWNTPVAGIEKNAVLLEDQIRLDAGAVVAAVNGFSEQLLPGIAIKPARGYVFVTRPLKNVKWKGACHYNRGYVYFRDLPGSRMLIGGGRHIDKTGEESMDNRINPKVKSWLLDFANSKLGLEDGWEIEQEWTGTMGFAANKSPVCSKLVNGIYCAAGLGGMGVALGMELGRTMAEKIEL